MTGDEKHTDQHGAPAEAPPEVRAVYGPQDLSAVPAFQGGFINFGHWDGIPLDRPLTADDRVHSERNLYRRVLRTLTADGDTAGRALEVGCGLGLGCALALEEFGFAAVTGMDIHPDQLDRARRANAERLAAAPGRLRFVRGAAEAMPCGDAAFDHLYTVEAAQHFRDLAAFARESARVLRPGGRLAVTSFFVPSAAPEETPEETPEKAPEKAREKTPVDAPRTADAAKALADRLDSFASGLDRPHALSDLRHALASAGFTDVRAESIGESVWPGFDHYLAGVPLPVTWPRNFLPAYRDGLLDYYVITARRPAEQEPPGSGTSQYEPSDG
ncbi:class I SAM-dependent methyltransferase [Streptomyces coeruleoprunus]|uniref:Class I SAM-dependent methyltransferase n=1 Tax=Streptomyces coeruleoprunus TaxID=285563 RepID=A0ABV9XCG4_9ACTN